MSGHRVCRCGELMLEDERHPKCEVIYCGVNEDTEYTTVMEVWIVAKNEQLAQTIAANAGRAVKAIPGVKTSYQSRVERLATTRLTINYLDE